MQLVAVVALTFLALGFAVEEDAPKNRPVSKVIKLLEDMMKQMEKEGKEDQDVFDKMACWCEVNEKEKTKSIADAEARIGDLTNKIEELTAQSAQLTTEVAKLEKEVAKNQEALNKATAIREEELAAFNAEEKDLLGSISALKAAIVVLSKHNEASSSFLQMPRTRMLEVAGTMQREMDRHSAIWEESLSRSERRMVAAFIQSPEDYFDAEPTFKQAYAPQSSQIFGILKQMRDTFEGNLKAGQEEEAKSQKSYEEVKAAKEEEIAAGQSQLDEKTQLLAETDEKNAQAKQDLEDTRKSLQADQEFLEMLKEKCAQSDKEFEERQQTRQTEMEACSKAMAVLSGDEAHDLFSKTFNPSFMQQAVAAFSERRSKASKLLSTVAHKLRNPRLATLAVSVRLDAFTKVKKAIDDMISQLLVEQADEVKHKDFCVDELNTNKLETEDKDREHKKVTSEIEDLTMAIDALTKALETLKAEVAELRVQLKRAGEDREIQNKEFQVVVADQRATKKLLTAALRILEEVYGKQERPQQGVVQLQEPAGPPPPAGFEDYSKSKMSGGVMGMIQQIIDDSTAMEGETIRSEEDAQKAYESFVKETNASIDAKSEDIVNKSATKAKAEVDLTDAHKARDEVNTALEDLAAYNGELHTSCDFILKNFDLRQEARSEEVEALRQANQILSGAKFGAFVQGA